MSTPPGVIPTLESSIVVGAADRGLSAADRAVAHSTAARWLRQARERWRQLPHGLQQRAGGVALLTAAVVHVALALWRQTPPGWLWLVIPALSAAVGVVLLMASTASPRTQAPSPKPQAPSPRRPIRVLVLSPIPEEGAGCRFRVSHYVPYLEAHGFTVTVRSFYTPDFFRLVYRPGHFLRKSTMFLKLLRERWKVLDDLDRYDLVWIYREAVPIGPPVIERRIARRGLPIVYDFDDAIFLPGKSGENLPSTSEANKAFAFLKNPGKVAEIVAASRHVAAGNSFLADYARQFNPAVTVLPTVIDTSRFVPRADRERIADSGPVVGWIGSPTTFHYLERMAGLLKDMAARHRFTLKVSGAGKPVKFDGVSVTDVPWALDREVELFNTCDIGVYPLEDDDWARGKCGFKAIQFMACGVPVVAAAVGVNREIIRDGEDGFLASTPAEWTEKLGRLLTDPALRARFSAAGRQRIEERYSLRATAPQLARILNQAVAVHT